MLFSPFQPYLNGAVVGAIGLFQLHACKLHVQGLVAAKVAENAPLAAINQHSVANGGLRDVRVAPVARAHGAAAAARAMTQAVATPLVWGKRGGVGVRTAVLLSKARASCRGSECHVQPTMDGLEKELDAITPTSVGDGGGRHNARVQAVLHAVDVLFERLALAFHELPERYQWEGKGAG